MGDGTDTLKFSYDAQGRIIGVQRNSTNYYYMHNVQGDVVALYDDQGNIVCRYTYDAWGNVISVKDANGTSITSATHIANLNPIRYRGYYYDTETKLYYLQTRYYNPEWGRFLNADSLFVAGAGLVSSNMFAYCGNNPVMFADPSGMDAEVKTNLTFVDSVFLVFIMFLIGVLISQPVTGGEIADFLAPDLSKVSAATLRAAAKMMDALLATVNLASQTYNEIKRDSKDHPTWYWRAEVRTVRVGGNDLKYVQRMGALTSKQEAADYIVNRGGSVFAGSRVAAIELLEELKVKNAWYEIDDGKREGYQKGVGSYYYHYHVGASHIWFLM